MKLYDLHTHVLPGVDDGAPNPEFALQMLHNAAASDVALLAVTPHCCRRFGNYMDQALQQRFAQLKQAAKNIPVELVLGAEARVDEDFHAALSQQKIPTINGSRYLLTEFCHDETDFDATLQSILDQGYIPLIAHPERYTAVCRNPEITFSWLDMGCHLQLTGDSILGEYGKTVQRTSSFLLQHDLVACVASDAHSLHHRSNYLMGVCDHLTVAYSKQYARCLLYENPLRICSNEDI